MKNKTASLLLAALFYSVSVHAEGGYRAGTAVVSIEPYESLISLHLGGYGAPRDGRFSLQWVETGKAPEGISLTGAGDKLFLLANEVIMSNDPGKPATEWKKEADAGDIVSIAGNATTLYCLREDRSIYETSLAGKIRWKKAGTADPAAVMIAVAGGFLYATDGNGSMWKYTLNGRLQNPVREKIMNDVIAFTSEDDRLFALTGDGVIYRLSTSGGDGRWLKIAYRNNETIKEDIRKIAFLRNRIYGTDIYNTLYKGEHRTEGNLTARALAISDGAGTVVILNVDVCGLTADFTGTVKKELSEKYGLPPSAVFINSSHTHFAPVSQNWLTWQEANQHPDSVFLWTIVKNGILDATAEAINSMSPAELWFGRGKTDIGYNRSLRDHPELYDSDLDILKVVFTGIRQESYLFLAACHPVFSTAGTLHYTISANYPGVARKLVEERTGTLNALFLQGTAGDINPKDNGEYISGEKLANDVISTLGKPMTRLEGPVSFFLDTVDIPVKPWSREEISAFRKENEGKPGDVYAEKNVKWADLMTGYYDKGTMPHSMPVYVHTINIGNWKLVGFSRETTTGYSFGVKQIWPGKMVSVAGYTNDVSSYLPTHMHLEAKNYEGLDSFFWYGMANVFPMNADEIILGKIRELAH